jgi:phosphoribosylformylglycinamidine cyclo-ligase
MCVNDLVVQGAQPLFFLDYYATGRLVPAIAGEVVAGIGHGCQLAGCALIGGETAEMPGVYREGEVDVVGTIVGAVPRALLLDGSKVRVGDKLLGLRSSGLHTNGYSLARRVLFTEAGLKLADRPPELGGKSVGEALLAVHRSYLPHCLPLVQRGQLTAMAHITGGGLPDNVPRVLPKGTSARISTAKIPPLPICELIVKRGSVSRAEAYRVLNMGVGMVLCVRPEHVEAVTAHLRELGEEAFALGEIVAGEQAVVLE